MRPITCLWPPACQTSQPPAQNPQTLNLKPYTLNHARPHNLPRKSNINQPTGSAQVAHTAPSQSVSPPIPSPIQHQAGLPTPPEPADAAAGVLGMPQSALDRAEDPRPPPTTGVDALSAPPAQAISVAELGFDIGAAAAEPRRFCTGCGKGLPAGMVFCTGCGTPARELPSPPAFPAPSPLPRDSSPAVMAGSWPAGEDSSDEGAFEEGSDSEMA